MDITDVRVRRVNKDGKMKAVVSVTFDNVKSLATYSSCNTSLSIIAVKSSSFTILPPPH